MLSWLFSVLNLQQSLQDQLGRVSLLSGILFITLGLGSDGVPPLVQLRTPPPAITGLPNLPMSLSGYSYLIMKLGPLQFTRKGLSVASTAACLTFTVSCFSFSTSFFFLYYSVSVIINSFISALCTFMGRFYLHTRETLLHIVYWGCFREQKS